MTTLIFRYQTEGVSILVDLSVYSREAVSRAAYWLTDRCYVLISSADSTVLEVQIRPKSDPSGHPFAIEEIAGEFANSLLDHQLRREIGIETDPIRALIVAKAFAEAGMLDDPVPGELRDPVQIKDDSLVQIQPGARHTGA